MERGEKNKGLKWKELRRPSRDGRKGRVKGEKLVSEME